MKNPWKLIVAYFGLLIGFFVAFWLFREGCSEEAEIARRKEDYNIQATDDDI